MPTSCRPWLVVASRWRIWNLALLAALCCPSSTMLRAETYDNQLPAELSGMGVTEHLATTIPLNFEFRDETGRTVQLAKYLRRGGRCCCRSTIPIVRCCAAYSCRDWSRD